ncbi:MAG: hypothetical protein IPK64_18690 [bacterium]|nr:hypothetical protein [bacterium]
MNRGFGMRHGRRHHHPSIGSAVLMAIVLAWVAGLPITSRAVSPEPATDDVHMPAWAPVKMLADRERPLVYAIDAGGGGVGAARLLFISTDTGQVVNDIPIGTSPTDLTISYGEDRLYVTNWGRAETRVVDLATQTELPPLLLGSDVYKLNAGRPGRLYYEEEDQWIDIRAVNSTTGANLHSWFVREGDGEIDPTGRWYYHCDNNISNASIHKYDISANSAVEVAESLERPYGTRNLVMSADGSRLFWMGGYVYDADLNELGRLGGEIHATTLHGDLAFSSSRVYNVHTGAVVYTLPVTTQVMAVAGDQSALLYLNPGTGAIDRIPMSEIADVPGPGLNPVPADRSAVLASLSSLSWDQQPAALRYRAYFGPDSSAVATAQPGSPLSLGEVTETTVALDADLRWEQRYYWRVDQVGLTGDVVGPVWSFVVAPLTVDPQDFTVSVPVGTQPQPAALRVKFNSPFSGLIVKEDIPWLRVERQPESVGYDHLQVVLEPAGLTAGSYTGLLGFSWSGYEVEVPVTLDLFHLVLTKLLADRDRPWVYGLHTGTGVTNDARLVFINAATGTIDKVLPIGSNATDLTINYGEGRLYVSNWLRGNTRVVDLATQTELPPLVLGSDVYKLNAGRPGRLYYEEEDQWIDIHIVDTATGRELNTWFVREGDGEIDPTGSWYYHCDNNSSGATIQKYSLANDAPVQVAESLVHGYGSRNLVMSADGSRLFWMGGYMYDADLNELGRLGGEIHATTLHGDLAFSSSAVYNTHTGQAIHALPVTTQVIAVSADQTKVFLYDGSTGSVQMIPMSDIADVPGPGLNPVPADRSAVLASLSSLSWDQQPAALRYHAYFGPDSSAVATAQPGSPLSLGEVTETTVALDADLRWEQRYYWRVDQVRLTGDVVGPVWSFVVAPLTVDPEDFTVSVPVGTQPQPAALRVKFNSPFSGLIVKEDIPWLRVERQPESVGYDHLQVVLEPAGLTAGSYTGLLGFSWSGYEVEVPVTLDLFNLVLTKLLADRDRPWVYGLHTGTGVTNDARLVFINAATGTIDKVLPIGSNATDLTINYGEGRLYVSNWLRGNTRVVDLATQTELPPLVLGSDVYKLNAGRPGRLYYEEEDQWIDIHIVDTATGRELNTWFVREGDGEIDPTGSWYYHCDNNSSGATIQKYSLANDAPVQVAESLVHGYGSRNLVMSADGSRLFWMGGYMYDADLNELGRLGGEIYATTLHGDLAFSSSRVYNTHTGAVVYTLPVTTQVIAVSADQTKVFLYNGGTGSVQMIPMSDIADVPGPGHNPVPADGSTVVLPVVRLSWDLDPAAIGYDVYAGCDSTAVAGGDVGDVVYLGRVSGAHIDFPSSPALGSTCYWRLDGIGLNGVARGAVWSFKVFPLSVEPGSLALALPTSLPEYRTTLVIGAEAMAGVEAWSATSAAPWLDLDAPGGSAGATLELRIDPAVAGVGEHLATVVIEAGGESYELPVSLQAFVMQITQMVADQQRGRIYALHPGGNTVDDDLLVVYDMLTRRVIRALPIGGNVTDMTVHQPDGRLYVTNWLRNVTRVIDLNTMTELPPLQLGADVYRINALGAGRLVVEEEDQWISAGIIDTQTGATLSSTLLREGDGAADPTGAWYYHCDNNISNAAVHKYATGSGTLAQVAVSPQHPYGSRNLVMSADGSRLFWRGYVYDANLRELGYLGGEVKWANEDGSRALIGSTIYDVAAFSPVSQLAFTPTAMALGESPAVAYAFDPDSGLIEAVFFDQVAVELSGFRAERLGNTVRVSWETSGAESGSSYRVERRTAAGQPDKVLSALVSEGNSWHVLDGEVGSASREYWLIVSYASGQVVEYGPAMVTAVPTVLALQGNHPNPFNPETTVEFTTNQEGPVRLQVFDLRGALVATLVDTRLPAGWHEAAWSGVDDRGQPMTSGVYVLRLWSEQGVRSRKMTLVR